MKREFNVVFGGAATLFIYLLGGWDIALQTLLTVMALDYVTGLSKAIYNGNLNSEVGLKGIVKKVGYLVIVALSVIIDRIFGDTGAVRTLVIYFFVANEGLSILENWGAMGMPIPRIIFDKLEKLKGDDKNGKSNVS